MHKALYVNLHHLKSLQTEIKRFKGLKNWSLFSVSVEGTKQSQVEAKLLKDGKALPLKDVEIVVGEDKITFKIKKPSRDQSGVYQVKISNNQGEEVNDVNINMQGKKTKVLLQTNISLIII